MRCEYEIVAAAKERLEEMLDIQVEAFLNREPMTMALGMDEAGYRRSMAWMFEYGMEAGTIFLALEKETKKVIGVMAAYPSDFPDNVSIPEGLMDGYEEQFADSAALLERMDQKIANRPGFKEGKFFHLYYVAVHKDFGRNGIATALLTHGQHYSEAHGYLCTYAETTNPKSLSGFLTAGGEIVDRIAYADSGIARFEPLEGELVLVIKRTEKQ